MVAISLGGHQMRDQKREMGRFWAYKKPFDREYLENGKSQRYISIKSLTSARRELSKNASQEAVAILLQF